MRISNGINARRRMRVHSRMYVGASVGLGVGVRQEATHKLSDSRSGHKRRRRCMSKTTHGYELKYEKCIRQL